MSSIKDRPQDSFIYDVDSLVKDYEEQGFPLVELRNRLAEYIDIIDEYGFNGDDKF